MDLNPKRINLAKLLLLQSNALSMVFVILDLIVLTLPQQKKNLSLTFVYWLSSTLRYLKLRTVKKT
jgi:hypothetical protein